jgi:hypothetical protein
MSLDQLATMLYLAVHGRSSNVSSRSTSRPWAPASGRRRMGPIAFPTAQKTVAQSALTLTTVQPSLAA